MGVLSVEPAGGTPGQRRPFAILSKSEKETFATVSEKGKIDKCRLVTDALLDKLDLKCLGAEEGVDELLNVDTPRALTVAFDSGAGHHVASGDQVGTKSIRTSAGSKDGRHFTTANGDRMRNQGQAELNMVAPGGRSARSVFQIVDVTRALLSVSKVCDEGREVNSTQTEAIVTNGGKVVTRFAREGGFYCVEMQLKDEPSNDGVAPFAGQGVKR
jgi:hypothetical protein